MEWYDNDVELVEQQLKALNYEPSTLFYGSSSIRLWNNFYEDFKDYCPANMGFGGSTLEACIYYFDRLMNGLRPSYMVLYAGDNDLGDGKNPGTVLSYFVTLNKLIRKRFGNIPYTYISIKPSVARWSINDAILRSNQLIKDTIRQMDGGASFVDIYSAMLGANGLPLKELYDDDGLHLSPQGYKVWKEILLAHISSEINADSIKCPAIGANIV